MVEDSVLEPHFDTVPRGVFILLSEILLAWMVCLLHHKVLLLKGMDKVMGDATVKNVFASLVISQL